jgi:hypothetical protein
MDAPWKSLDDSHPSALNLSAQGRALTMSDCCGAYCCPSLPDPIGYQPVDIPSGVGTFFALG